MNIKLIKYKKNPSSLANEFKLDVITSVVDKKELGFNILEETNLLF